MADNFDNGTLKDILSQLRTLNTNLSTGNLLGDKNRLFRSQGEKNGWDAWNEQQRRLRDDTRDNIKGLLEIVKDHNFSEADRRQARKELRENRLKNIKHSAGAAATPEAVLTTAKNLTNTIFSVLETQIKKQTVRLQAASELQTRAIQTYGKALNNAIAVQVGNVTGNVLDTAYQSLNAVIEGGRSIYMKSLSDAITYRQRENEIYKANVEMVTGAIESAGGALASFGGTVGLVGNALSMMASVGKRYAMIIAARTELEIKQSEEVKKNQDAWLEQMEGVVKQFADMSKQVTKSFLEAGNSAYAYGRTVGFSGNSLKLYHDRLIEGVNVELSKLAMDFNDYTKMQASYEGATGGRTGILSTNEAMMLGGLSKRLGLSAEEASTMVGSMNVFNTSIADGSQMIYEMSRMANRMGLSANKFTKDMEKNLKLAEKYQFRGGVKGMMEMALWAQKMRFNMDELTSLQEKALSGNIEEMIQTSARLNVLGGNAALFSDPMQMLYNGINDPAALAKNINRMIGGYGRFNAATGETEFNSVEMLRMNAIAQATGMSRENLMNQARQAQKSSQIGRQYGGKFGKMTDFVTQNATWSKEKGDWIVKVNAPNTKEGFVEKSLSELSGANDEALQNIFPEDKQDRLIEYVKDIRKFLSSGEWQTASEKNSLAVAMGEASSRNFAERQKAFADERFRVTGRNRKEVGDIIDDMTNAAWDAQRAMNESIQTGDMSQIVRQYTQWSTTQNTEMLEQMGEFAKSGQSIDDHLTEIEALVRMMTPQQLKEKKEQAAFNTKNWKEIEKTLDKNYWGLLPFERKEREDALRSGEAMISETGTYLKRGINGEPIRDNTVRMGRYKPEFVKDAVITPRGTVYTHPNDIIAAFKPNGPIAQTINEKIYPTITQQTNPNNQHNNTQTDTVLRSVIGAMSKVSQFIPLQGLMKNVYSNIFPPAFIDGINQISNKRLLNPVEPIAQIINENVYPSTVLPEAQTPIQTNTYVNPVNASTQPQVNKLEVSGTLRLETNGQNVDLMALIKSNPDSMRRLAEEVIIEGSKTRYGGRSLNAPGRYTLG